MSRTVQYDKFSCFVENQDAKISRDDNKWTRSALANCNCSLNGESSLLFSPFLRIISMSIVPFCICRFHHCTFGGRKLVVAPGKERTLLLAPEKEAGRTPEAAETEGAGTEPQPGPRPIRGRLLRRKVKVRRPAFRSAAEFQAKAEQIAAAKRALEETANELQREAGEEFLRARGGPFQPRRLH